VWNYIILIHVIIASHKDDDDNCIQQDGEYDLPYRVPFLFISLDNSFPDFLGVCEIYIKITTTKKYEKISFNKR